LVGGLALFGAAVALARYGLDPSDEGYIVYSAVEVAAGRVPYRDLNSLYTPLSWYLHAAVFKLVGVDLVVLRVWFSLVAAGLAIGLYLLARQLMRPALAVLPLLSFVLLFPVPQNWAPYPAWYALAGLLGALLALGRWCDDRRARWLVVAGVGCGVAFGCKSNLGLLGLMACCGWLFLQGPSMAKFQGDRATSGLARLVPAGFVVGCVLALWLLIRETATPGNQLVLVAPVLIAGLLLVHGSVAVAPALRASTVVLAGFVAVTLPWYVALSLVAGWQATFDAVFLAGARAAWAFYDPVVPPNRDAIEGLAWIAASLAGVPLLARPGTPRGLVARPVLLLLATGLGLAAAGVIARAALDHQDLATSVADNLSARWVRTASAPADLPRVVPFVAELAGLGLVAWRRLTQRPDDPRLALLVWFCVLLAFQLYPHASYLHVLFSWGPFLVLLGALVAEIWDIAEARLPGRGWRWAAFPLLAVLPLLLVPNAWRGRATVIQQSVPLELPHAAVRAKTDDAARLRMVQARTASLPADAPLFAYPEVAMVYVVTGHPNPTRENYLATGYVDEAGQLAVIERLEATQTRFVVWDREAARRLESNAWYGTLTEYLRRAYAPVAEQDDWLLMERQPTQARSAGRRRRSQARSPD
ncbi:MAG TPA: glycosyltransferase family 39 protein, partial [Chloroflexota bacterium]|nr:glycosyltransferase family 39 protein [Chloroflexota bacterium]